MKKYRGYLSYKNSNVNWIGTIPTHWEIMKIKHSSYVKGRVGWQGLNSEEFSYEGPFLVTGTDFINGKINWLTCYHVSEERYNQDPYITLRNGDLLITKDGTIGKLAIVDNMPDKATLNSGIFVIRSIKKKYITEYLFWLLSSNVFLSFIDFIKTGTTINHLYQEAFTDFSFAVPPLSEQRAIADFLDRETARIDALITKYQRLMELLEEKRTSLISQAVTKGLDSTADMKDSGVEWLGQIPEHWELFPLGLHSELIVPMRDKPQDLSGNIPWIRIEDFDGKYIFSSKSQQGVSIDTIKTMNLKVFPIGTVLCTCSCNMGRTAIVSKPIISNQTFIGINPDKYISSDYLYYLMKVCQEHLSVIATGAIQQYLSRNDFSRLRIPIPPLSEQRAIADFLDRKTARIDSLKGQIMDMITKLQEYRIALISSAVTGKIDVTQNEVGYGI